MQSEDEAMTAGSDEEEEFKPTRGKKVSLPIHSSFPLGMAKR